jgi:hypothetical protein
MRKASLASQSPEHQATHRHVDEGFSTLRQTLVVPKLILLFWSIQAIVRSTTHLRGSTWKPLGGMILFQSTFTPSLAHSLAQAINTFSGAGFR